MNTTTSTGSLIKGIGIGMVAGAAISLAMQTKTGKSNLNPGKAVANIGAVIEQIGKNLG